MGWRPRFAHLQWAALAGSVALLLGSCVHDWDQWLPGGTPTGSGATTTTDTTWGGAGGGVIEGECPADHLRAPPLVRAVSPAGRAICIGRTEVTREQYQAFLQDLADGGWAVGGGYAGMVECEWNVDGGAPWLEPTGDWPPTVRLEAPVAYVDWCDALAFCLHRGQRLCGAVEGGGMVPFASYANASVSEWHAVCTNGDRTSFPYGNSYQPDVCYGDDVTPGAFPDPVGSRSGCRTAAGVYDLSGNVFEWENCCNGSSGPDDSCRQRGGAYQTQPSALTCAANADGRRSHQSGAIGFRCCADPIFPEQDAGTDAAGGGGGTGATGAGGAGGTGG